MSAFSLSLSLCSPCSNKQEVDMLDLRFDGGNLPISGRHLIFATTPRKGKDYLTVDDHSIDIDGKTVSFWTIGGAAMPMHFVRHSLSKRRTCASATTSTYVSLYASRSPQACDNALSSRHGVIFHSERCSNVQSEFPRIFALVFHGRLFVCRLRSSTRSSKSSSTSRSSLSTPSARR